VVTIPELSRAVDVELVVESGSFVFVFIVVSAGDV